MHISEGVLSPPVLATGAALSAAGLAWGLRKIEVEKLPQVALMAAVFFLASLIHLPVGPSSVHLVLNGLVGLMLGWAAFPALAVGLALQAILFQFGGLTGLGVNTFNMALPGVICYYLFSPWVMRDSRWASMAAGFAAGFCGVLFAALLTAVSLVASGDAFTSAAWAILAANLPGMVLEGVVTAAAVSFLRQVKPALLNIDAVH
jgi:cobalt/nickel transport system permease protein